MTLEERIARAVQDDHLHAALGTAARTLRERRAVALTSVEDVEGVRDAARAQRLAGIPQVDALISGFTERASARGVHVHRAADGAEAIARVVSIAERLGLRRAVKSKSMATEEIHLNAGLEAAGIAVRETDLGEYIVQLADDRPSHIILPIVHMDRSDVGRVMERELDVPFTDEPEELAAIARARLREDFLAADLGISGANLAVAETGGIVLVSNEGNIRMVTSLPRVHVAIVGTDKLVPTLADAERILRLLSRSATGQQSTVYTTFVNGPRTDDEGPDEVHVVFLDNGRAHIRAGEHAEILGCIRCGACLNACPVYRQVGGHTYDATYPGPLGAVFMAALPGEDHEELPSLCTLCGACEQICPVRLDLPGMLLSLRAEKAARRGGSRRLAMRLFAALMSRPWLLRLGRRIGSWWLRRGSSDGWRSSAPAPLAGWTASRDLPVPARASFWDTFVEDPSVAAVSAQSSPQQTTFHAPESHTSPGSSQSSPTQTTLATFVAAAEALTATVFIEDDAAAVCARVASLIGDAPVLRWDHLPYGLDPAGVDDPAQWPHTAIGVTGADGGIAATGALILGSRADQPRRPSLLPPHHIAVLRRGDIHDDLEAALIARRDLLDSCSSVHVIAGPSRTADIELHLTLGVHGPGRVTIVIGP